MNKQIVLSDKFQDSLKVIIRNSNYLPKNFYEKILSKIQNLNTFSEMYPISKNPEYRKISFQNHIILYKIENNQIRISDIVPTKMKSSIQYLY